MTSSANWKTAEEGGRGVHYRELVRKVAERNWIGISWPKEYGGQGGSRIEQYIVEEEFARVGVAVGGAGSGAPAILAAGTEEQKQEFIPGMINGDIIFALGFTEPQAGADLAGLQCRAVRDGDEYVINGQKMYTSAAHYATHIYLMARTDPDAPRHRGISIFLVPMDTPGITVRPSLDHSERPARAAGHHLRHGPHQRDLLRGRARPCVHDAGRRKRRLVRRRHGA